MQNLLVSKEVGSVSGSFIGNGNRYMTILHSSSTPSKYHTTAISKPTTTTTIPAGPWDLTESKSLSPFAKAIQQTLVSILPDKTDSQSFDFKCPMHITVSVSGGCDSVALLHACMEWLHPWLEPQNSISMGVSIHVVHFNHEQRGEESDQDAVFVQELCDKYGIPCHVQNWSDPQRASTLTVNNDSPTVTCFSQDTARQWRRQFLQDYTQQQLQRHTQSSTDVKAVGVILTAHHRDDAMESLLLKALRGVHLFNLSGMKAISSLTNQDQQQQDDTNSAIYLVRPWLEQPKLQLKGFDKADILQYLHASNYTWRDDKSNDSNKYLRNRVRHQLMPLLQDLTHGGLASRLDHWVQQSEQLREDVQPRVQAHLKQILVPSTREPGRFVLDWEKSLAQTAGDDDTNHEVSTLIRSQALYEWITSDIAFVQGKQALRDLVSHDTLQRVLHQLVEYPKNVEWTLQLGKGWNIVRKGNILQLKPDIMESSSTSASTRSNDQQAKQCNKVWGWRVVVDTRDTAALDPKHVGKFYLGEPIQLDIPKEWIVSCDKQDTTSCWSVQETTVAKYESMLQQEIIHHNDKSNHATKDVAPSNTRTAIMFLPPKSKSKPIKLRSFLRRQGVSFADRDDTPILVGRSSSSTVDNTTGNAVTRLLAVQVPVYEDATRTSDIPKTVNHHAMEWIVHGDHVIVETGQHVVPSSSSNHQSIRVALEPPPPPPQDNS